MILMNLFAIVFLNPAILDRLLSNSELRYPYEGSKTPMHVFDRFEDTELVLELLDGMYAELPAPKKKKK